MPATPLPYTDTKPVGAADFYLAINATFRFLFQRFGLDGLRRYWSEMGTTYYRPVTQQWQAGGVRAIAEYWRAFFAAEPAAEVEVAEQDNGVTIQVKACPAFKNLRQHQREIIPCFCQQCYFVSEAMAAPAGFTVRVQGGNGACMQRFARRDSVTEPQRLEEIKEAT